MSWQGLKNMHNIFVLLLMVLMLLDTLQAKTRQTSRFVIYAFANFTANYAHPEVLGCKMLTRVNNYF